MNAPDTGLASWTDADLLACLRERYAADPVPPCRVCGGELSIASCGGGRPTEWACSTWEDDPDKPGELRRKDGRSIADAHYERSFWTQYRGGDEAVLELVARVERAARAGDLALAVADAARCR